VGRKTKPFVKYWLASMQGDASALCGVTKPHTFGKRCESSLIAQTCAIQRRGIIPFWLRELSLVLKESIPPFCDQPFLCTLQSKIRNSTSRLINDGYLIYNCGYTPSGTGRYWHKCCTFNRLGEDSKCHILQRHKQTSHSELSI
jgi:hypothetical protein